MNSRRFAISCAASVPSTRRSPSCARWKTTRRGVPDALWKQLGEIGVLGIRCAGGARRRRAGAARGGDRLRGTGPRARADPRTSSRAFVCASALLAAGERGAAVASGCRGSRAARRSSRPRGSSRERGFGAQGVQRARAARRLDLGARRHEARRRVRVRSRRACSCSRARATRRATSTLFLVDPRRARRYAEQQRSLASDTQYEVALAGVRVDDTARVGAANAGWATWEPRCAKRIVVLAALANGRLPSARSRSPCSTRRTASSSTSRSARSRRSRTIWPTRRPHSTAARPRLRGRRGVRRGRRARTPRADGEALRVRHVPRRHRDVSAGVGRRRLHRRIRHPALLPPREAAPAHLAATRRSSRSWIASAMSLSPALRRFSHAPRRSSRRPARDRVVAARTGRDRHAPLRSRRRSHQGRSRPLATTSAR